MKSAIGRNVSLAVISILAVGFYFAFIYKASVVIGEVRYFTLFDDAMISMRYAANLAGGNGLVWNSGEFVEGYTNFLWTLWMSVIHLLPLDESKMALPVSLTGVIILIANLFVTKSIASKISGGSDFTQVLSVLFTAFYFGLIYWTLRGMEVGLLTLLVNCAALVLLNLQDGFTRRKFSALIFFSVCMLLTRSDTFVIILFFALYLYLSTGISYRKKLLLLYLASVILTLAAHTLFRVIYYQDLLPNTYYLKLSGFSLYDRLYRGLSVFAEIFASRLLPYAIPVVLYMILDRRFIEWRKVLLPAGIFSVTVLYSIYVGGDSWEWMPYTNRFITLSIPMFLILCSLSIERLYYRLRSQKHLIISSMALAVYIGSILTFFGGRMPEYEFIPGVAWIDTRILIVMSLVYLMVLTGLSLTNHTRLQSNSKFGILLKVNVCLVCLITFFISNGYAYTAWLTKNAMFVEQDSNNARLGLKLRNNTSEDVRIADVWAGNTPYFSQRYSVDLLGKMNKKIAKDKPRDDIFLPGHSKWDHKYSIENYKPDLILNFFGEPDEELKEFLIRDYQRVNRGYYIRKESAKINRDAF